MKKLMVLLCAGVFIAASCSNEKGRYVDLRTGETIDVKKDDETGRWVNAETKKPVYIYVDTRKDDTIYGRTGEVINGHVVKSNNVYWYEMDEEYKVKSGDYKMKVEDDGDIKIKTDDKKVKIDGKTGERKEKND
ncbi:MAG TPA: hypothetical protein VF476_08475 [Chitinophagaceae bacterium]